MPNDAVERAAIFATPSYGTLSALPDLLGSPELPRGSVHTMVRNLAVNVSPSASHLRKMRLAQPWRDPRRFDPQ